jgi:hypothetical protein
MQIDLNRPDTVEVLRQDCIDRVTNGIAATMRFYIPDIPGQVEIYRAKYMDAMQVRFAGNNAGPLVADYAAAAGISTEEAASRIMEKYMAWQDAIHAVENIRIRHKAAIATMTEANDILQETANAIAACDRLRAS